MKKVLPSVFLPRLLNNVYMYNVYMYVWLLGGYIYIYRSASPVSCWSHSQTRRVFKVAKFSLENGRLQLNFFPWREMDDYSNVLAFCVFVHTLFPCLQRHSMVLQLWLPSCFRVPVQQHVVVYNKSGASWQLFMESVQIFSCQCNHRKAKLPMCKSLNF